MTDIISNPAHQITAQSAETLDEYSARIRKSSMKPIRYKDGTPIELDPKLQYSFLMMGLTRLATPEEFGALYTAIMTTVAQMEASGALPEGWVKTVATPFDVLPPAVPEQYTENIGEDEVKTFLVGEAGFSIVRVSPPPPPEPEPPLPPEPEWIPEPGTEEEKKETETESETEPTPDPETETESNP